ncbi:heavy-metal-associated domain-containing protein [Acetobacter sp. AN02]|uniref:heavy-metal-associated domain-containing protein n=1 Tax=Acetobacter sp. AN02 TaxID=2894186 RepID=UPI0024342F8F|nr:heavy metal-associated domain-containing protein [Acetobacter sp. AN02]MDG6095220.1 heavy-metal-associated domain-containing protein [Acetobacter sp. AN02]
MSDSLTLRIGGMTCGGCSSSLQKALSAADGVTSASVSHEDGTAVITYDPEKISPDALRQVVEGTGFDVL